MRRCLSLYNLTWREHGAVESEKERRGFHHVRLAREAASKASPVEQRLIEALAARYQKPHAATVAEFAHWDDAYAVECAESTTSSRMIRT